MSGAIWPLQLSLRWGHTALQESSDVKVRIGIADTGREVEVEVDSRHDVVNQIEEAFAGAAHVLWFSDLKGGEVGIPIARIAFVELESESNHSVGF